MAIKSNTNYNEFHYDSITDAWKFILGENFHYGYFESGIMDLKSATNHLIDVLAGMDIINEKSDILDVGCGMGGPALYIYEKYHCRITGISTSKKGVTIANKAAEKKDYKDMVRFKLKDALDNGFSSNSFTLIWQMESSHLIRDKKKLFSENYRVLKNNGVMLLCDLILPKEFSISDLYNYRKELNLLEKSFGKVKMEPLEYYCQILKETGYSDVETVNISEHVIPTLKHWKKNIKQNRKIVLKHLNKSEIEIFIRSCEILDYFFKNNMIGYGLVKAKKIGGAIG
mgnify:CR=1 FL=1|jgi:27-O-demethylrifamycin SV methyltransferase